MKATSATRDHHETFRSKDLKPCEKFVGKDHTSFEVGIDDQYTCFFFSKDVPAEIQKWVDDNKYDVCPAIDELTFESFDDLLKQINEWGLEFHGDEDWKTLTKESKSEGGW